MQVQIRFFAAFREVMGSDQMAIALPETVKVARDMLDWLCATDANAQAVLANPARVHLAINNCLAGPNAPLSQGDVIDIFPPVSGG
jgi:sulfur-carrier protein